MARAYGSGTRETEVTAVQDTTIPDSHRDLVEPAGFGAFVTLHAVGFPKRHGALGPVDPRHLAPR